MTVRRQRKESKTAANHNNATTRMSANNEKKNKNRKTRTEAWTCIKTAVVKRENIMYNDETII